MSSHQEFSGLNSSKSRHSWSFTLAEVLITLTIVGVIAALTIPNLINKYTEHATVKKVQKFHSEIKNAYASAQKEYGNFEDWNFSTNDSENSEKIYNILIKPYFKVEKLCKNNNGDCIYNGLYKYLNGDWNTRFLSPSTITFTLADGTSVVIPGGQISTLAYIFIDVNGKLPPNQHGYDFFSFILYNGELIADGIPGKIKHGSVDFSNNKFVSIDSSNTCDKTSSNNWGRSGYGCTGWVIYKGNMDYLHCSDLSWTGKDKCTK